MAAERIIAAAQTERVLRLVRDVLGHDVLGAYQHGSAVLGGVQPTSDIDIMVIAGRLATLDPVPAEDCIKAMVGGIDVFMDEFEEDTRNLLLRLARVWQTVVTGIIDRKDRAADWALERLPSDCRPLMERARAIYLGRQPDEWTGMASEARAGADYMISQIRREAACRQPGQVLLTRSRGGG